MVIKDLLVHLDQTPVAQKRLDAALTLGQHFAACHGALSHRRTLRGAVGYHLPDEIAREHLRHAETEAETVFAAAREAAGSRGVVLETTVGLDRLPIILARNARNADLVVVGEPDPANNGTDDALLVEAAFMEPAAPRWWCPMSACGHAAGTRHHRLGWLARGGSGGS